jgi:hypothetical protein
MTDLHTALRALNDAAYAAVRAANSTPDVSPAYRERLRKIARATDEAVDDASSRPAA